MSDEVAATYYIRIAPSALEDIQTHYRWWGENRSKSQADAWYGKIFSAMHTLQHMPRRCVEIEESLFVGRELRQFLFGVSSKYTHRIIFEVQNDVVSVLRIYHLSQQLAPH